jgi:polar amino acid transport system substrate-binding protein
MFRLPVVLLSLSLIMLSACGEREKISDFSQLSGKDFAIPTGTIADQLVTSKIPDARFQYYNSVLDSAMAVKTGKADVAAYDEPILRNIAAKNPGLTVLSEKITTDQYGFAVRQGDVALKQAIDIEVAAMRESGLYAEMMQRWLPSTGNPAPMPEISLDGTEGVLRFGTAAITEPFAFVDGSQQIVGFDIEIAARVAKRLNRKLEIVDMEFGSLIPALMAEKVDMIGACITITDERAKKVLFSESYYEGGIAALVRQ